MVGCAESPWAPNNSATGSDRVPAVALEVVGHVVAVAQIPQVGQVDIEGCSRQRSVTVCIGT
jgi:hypothetical protein